MKKLLMYTVAVLMMAGFAVAQNTGGDKLVGGQEKPKPQPKPEVRTQATGKKGGTKNNKGKTPQFADGSVHAQKAPTPALNPQPLPPGLHQKSSVKTKNQKGGKKSADSTVPNNGTAQARPGVPPPTRPTDPK